MYDAIQSSMQYFCHFFEVVMLNAQISKDSLHLKAFGFAGALSPGPAALYFHVP
ncbi:hypothetical protein [Salipiger profundus]|uniref:hypothetical protein n=1 Tax=Salipiger profundus TaxID=1229727 RepID=UPI0013F4C4A9|nr:hypothetical protein [Salipiger profundus]